jgi:hypothetical protein
LTDDRASFDLEALCAGLGHNLLEGNQGADTIFRMDGISGNDVIISHNFGGDFRTFGAGDNP